MSLQPITIPAFKCFVRKLIMYAKFRLSMSQGGLLFVRYRGCDVGGTRLYQPCDGFLYRLDSSVSIGARSSSDSVLVLKSGGNSNRVLMSCFLACM